MMTETSSTPAAAPTQFAPGTPSWVDASSPDIPASKAFYTGLFGWNAIELPPEAGGYVMFDLNGAIVAAVGPTQGEGQPAAWSVYFATEDADETARKVEANGGKVVAPAFDVMDQGRMAVFSDPIGAFFSVWQATKMPGLGLKDAPNTFGWCELNGRGIDGVVPFYERVFGWASHRTEASQGGPEYVELQVDGKSLAGPMDLTGIPGMDQVPAHWLVYFLSADIDAAAKRVTDLGGKLRKEPTEYPGGKFAIVADPVGANFGLMTPGK